MPKFVIRKIPEIVGKIDFFKLEIDGKCEFDTFWRQCENHGAYRSELLTLQIRMQQVSELKTLPDTKFKDISPKRSVFKQYEFKTKNLRVYAFHDKSNGRIIVLGGKKGTQKKDIKRFRLILENYNLTIYDRKR